MDSKTVLQHYFGYDSFRPHQEEIINSALSGQDCLVLMPTGGGKSMCFQIPALIMKGTCIVISPLISLMQDQVDALKSLGIEAAALNSANDFSQETLIRRRCVSGQIKLLYMSPERLSSEISHLLRDISISMFAIDEAHCISQWGHDFRPDYLNLSQLRDSFPDVPIMALTATADKITRKDIAIQLKLRNHREYVSSFDRPNLSLSVKRGYRNREKIAYIINFIKARPLDPGIIYCLTRKTTEQLAENLKGRGIKAEAYNAGMDSATRSDVQQRFKQDDVQVICATIAFGMGIDKSNIRWIIHYNLPKSIESYYQEIGRAGRDGAPADTILFYSLSDIIQIREFNKESGQKEINDDKLKRMREYAESVVCRRRILLNYFGESSPNDCGNCDVCANPPERFDGTIYVQMALSASRRTKEKAAISTITEILMGISSPIIKKNGYDLLPTFGVGKKVGIAEWQDYLLQMYQMGLIDVVYNEGRRISITPLGEEVLFGKRQAMLSHVSHESKPKTRKQPRLQLVIPDMSVSETIGKVISSITGSEDKKLFDALRGLRKRIADSEGCPPYIIFSDKVLHSMASVKPKTIEQFGSISGIGDYKKAKYGKSFTEFIRNYYEGK